ncbi:MAG: hypothetical protein SGARI_000686 [Bacillariaceae sp.]
MEVKDQIYSFELARRAVGRAAHHLGISVVSESCLDVLADVLLQYLQRTGKAAAHLVESSGRSTAHVNVLDALQACHVVASPAVQRLHLQSNDDANLELFGAAVAGAASTTGGAAAAVAAASDSKQAAASASTGTAMSSFGQDSSTDWKGLAAFCFGPKWMEEKEEETKKAGVATTSTDVGSAIDDMMELDSDDEQEQAENDRPGGGKGRGTGSKRAGGDGDDEEEDAQGGNSTKRKNKGWNAPYLDDISEYPQASDACANPHNLPARTKLSLHYRKTDIDAWEVEEQEEATQQQLDSMSDDVFVKGMAVASKITGDSSFGSMKRKLNLDGADKDDSDAAPPTKRVRLNDGKAAGTATASGADDTATGKHDGHDSKMPADFSYVPAFYPLPPSTKEVVERGRTVVDLQEQQQKMMLQNDVYGSTKSVTPDKDDLEDSQVVRSSLVNMGQSYWGSGWDNNNSTAAAVAAAVPAGRPKEALNEQPEYQIRPVDKPSGTRVTRILEGSMDAAAMQ